MNNVKFDLEERTAAFGESVIKFIRSLPKNQVYDPLIRQLLRSATSVGANYCEADDAESRKDFRHKLSTAKKEARESMHWLRLLSVAMPEYTQALSDLRQEAKELNLIFNAIIKSTDRNSGIGI